jgi:hypothetical protein
MRIDEIRTTDHGEEPLEGREFAMNGFLVKFLPDKIEIFKGPTLIHTKKGNYSQPTRSNLWSVRGMTLKLQADDLRRSRLNR